jgi:hypothetical protein
MAERLHRKRKNSGAGHSFIAYWRRHEVLVSRADSFT